MAYCSEISDNGCLTIRLAIAIVIGTTSVSTLADRHTDYTEKLL